MSKLPDLDVFDRGQIINARRKIRPNSEIVIQLICQQCHTGQQCQENTKNTLMAKKAITEHQRTVLNYEHLIQYLASHSRGTKLFVTKPRGVAGVSKPLSLAIDTTNSRGRQVSICASLQIIDRMQQNAWDEMDYRLDVCLVTKGSHIEHLLLKKT
ncbi:hypothetical protein TNCV_2835331 [Trichonephila clavipes]|uniref:Uncharacterized protein n=1 Tax=Trichonephila clavipes TaxID=2585209 RepID=A0A8X6RTA3_TRICX|nr:hypothetical protein TNCV_2835331 [Trichonephila clavipes]